MTQVDRVLAAVTRAGARGITAVDFAAPDVIDGGKPIMRVAARINDIRNDGIAIVTDGERNGCAVYKLASAIDQEETPCAPASESADTGGGGQGEEPAPTGVSGLGSRSAWRLLLVDG